MIPLSEIVIWFYENYPKFTYSKTAEIKFERMDLEMLVGMRILTMRYDPDFGTMHYSSDGAWTSFAPGTRRTAGADRPGPHQANRLRPTGHA